MRSPDAGLYGFLGVLSVLACGVTSGISISRLSDGVTWVGLFHPEVWIIDKMLFGG